MIGAYLRRGLAAGLVAGVLAGMIGLAVAEPALDEAIALEDTGSSGHGAGPVVTRPQQKAGMVGGYALVGASLGALFGVASAWAVGRVRGDGWMRSLKLGAVATGALVILPALKYPPNPPGIGDPATVGTRTLLYLALGLAGLVAAAAAWAGSRQVGAAAWAPARQTVMGVVVVAATAVIVAVLPTMSAPQSSFPAELLWRFRLGALGTQAVLWVGTAVAFGLLTARRERSGETA